MIARSAQRDTDIACASSRDGRTIERTDRDISAARQSAYVPCRATDDYTTASGADIGAAHRLADSYAAAGFPIDDATAVVVANFTGALVDRDVPARADRHAALLVEYPRLPAARGDVVAFGIAIDNRAAARAASQTSANTLDQNASTARPNRSGKIRIGDADLAPASRKIGAAARPLDPDLTTTSASREVSLNVADRNPAPRRFNADVEAPRDHDLE